MYIIVTWWWFSISYWFAPNNINKSVCHCLMGPALNVNANYKSNTENKPIKILVSAEKHAVRQKKTRHIKSKREAESFAVYWFQIEIERSFWCLCAFFYREKESWTECERVLLLTSEKVNKIEIRKISCKYVMWMCHRCVRIQNLVNQCWRLVSFFFLINLLLLPFFNYKFAIYFVKSYTQWTVPTNNNDDIRRLNMVDYIVSNFNLFVVSFDRRCDQN